VPGAGGEVLIRSPLRDSHLTIPLALEMEAYRVICPTPPAEVAHHLVLDRSRWHSSHFAEISRLRHL
jgi:hypothetical protein